MSSLQCFTTRLACVRLRHQTEGSELHVEQLCHRQVTADFSRRTEYCGKEAEARRAHLFLSGNEEHPRSRGGRSQPGSVKNKHEHEDVFVGVRTDFCRVWIFNFKQNARVSQKTRLVRMH